MLKDGSIIMVKKSSNQGACSAVYARPLNKVSIMTYSDLKKELFYHRGR